jgi:outer membrane protein assembly factor BamB
MTNDQGKLTAVLFSAIALTSALTLASTPDRPVNGTIWVANRGLHNIRGFDAGTGAIVKTIEMAPGSQPGDLAYAKGKLYVAEEFGTPPAIAVLDEASGDLLTRIVLPAGSRPHHVHASSGGNLVAVGMYGTDMVAVVDTHDDALLGPWDTNIHTTNGRIHAGVFSQDEQTLYLTSDASNEVLSIDPRSGTVFWRMTVPGAHELALTHNEKIAYVSRRTANRLAVIDLEQRTFTDFLTLGLPDSLRLSANEKLLTVGLRTMPAQLAVVLTDTVGDDSVQYDIVDLAPGEATSLGAHQWTSPSGRFTYAAFEGGSSPGLSDIDHLANNQVVQRLSYPGRPHGVDHARPR